MKTLQNASWIEVSASALRNNVFQIKQMASSPLFGAVLKANAYGHGVEIVTEVLHDLVDVFFVISVLDACRIRMVENSKKLLPKRIVIIGSIHETELETIVDGDFEVAVADDSWENLATVLREMGKSVSVHIFLETGLYREGFENSDILQRYSFLKDFSDVLLPKAVYSHFANTEDVTEQSYAKKQMKNFEIGVETLSQILPKAFTLEKHFAASAATLLLSESRYDLVRVGISLYGYWPSQETRLGCVLLEQKKELIPALNWKVKSQLIKQVKSGSYIGYGCSYRCTNNSIIAVFPVGYFDGYPRALSGKAYVLVKGMRCPVVGRVMMNHILVDVSCLKTQLSEDLNETIEATLLGGDFGKESAQKFLTVSSNKNEDLSNEDLSERISVEMFSAWAQTIPYEIVSRIPGHLERKLVS